MMTSGAPNSSAAARASSRPWAAATTQPHRLKSALKPASAVGVVALVAEDPATCEAWMPDGSNCGDGTGTEYPERILTFLQHFTGVGFGDHVYAANLCSTSEELMAEIDNIVDLQVARLRKLVRERNLDLELTPEARTWLGDRGYDPQYGARPLKRALQRYVQDPLAKRLLTGEFKPGDVIVVGAPGGNDGEELSMTRKPERRVAAVS